MSEAILGNRQKLIKLLMNPGVLDLGRARFESFMAVKLEARRQ